MGVLHIFIIYANIYINNKYMQIYFKLFLGGVICLMHPVPPVNEFV